MGFPMLDFTDALGATLPSGSPAPRPKPVKTSHDFVRIVGFADTSPTSVLRLGGSPGRHHEESPLAKALKQDRSLPRLSIAVGKKAKGSLSVLKKSKSYADLQRRSPTGQDAGRQGRSSEPTSPCSRPGTPTMPVGIPIE